ncbi:MAG: hypothetical protein GY756_00415 [bacterium]|nr:hypothetical protein [bacterium]
MNTSREIVIDTINFNNPERLPFDLSDKFGSDFYYINMQPSVDDRRDKGVDEWGCEWNNIGICSLGEVKEFPLKQWTDFKKMHIPDITLNDRWKNINNAKNDAGDKFIIGFGISLFERIHFLRGLKNTWLDIYDSPKELSDILDILTDMNIYAIKKYAEAGADGYMFCDDWGFQNRLMISPDKWREIWKPRYKKVYDTAHKYGLYTFLHSCGYIIKILDDLVEVGLDVIQLDQQENMGIDELAKLSGKITFFCPVDIQTVLHKGSPNNIENYIEKMVKSLANINGGFISRWYADPVSAGHSEISVDTMSKKFIAISNNYKNYFNPVNHTT